MDELTSSHFCTENEQNVLGDSFEGDKSIVVFVLWGKSMFSCCWIHPRAFCVV